MVTATFRFHGELNDFLPRRRREVDLTCPRAREASAKHMIEALGVPHTEVGLILVNGAPVGFDYRPLDGDRVAVHPIQAAPDIRAPAGPRESPARQPRFVADAHLGGLAKLLRLAGFDTLYDNHFHDDDIIAIAGREGRIILTRDVELLKRKDVTQGLYVHALKPERQMMEIIRRLALFDDIKPFSLCLACNAPLRPVEKSAVLERLPERVRERHERFATCDLCRRAFWEGSHWRRMRALLARVMGDEG